ncbi:phenylalanine--tRNA ligase subunit alpha [Candidatus Micrarchaeota archaeon]|nr:phenylalanine--tRNA ligase subunit alpha [Candidatus Micrarchaeota archaeon]
MNELGRSILAALNHQDEPMEAGSLASKVHADPHAVMSALESLKLEGLVTLEQGKERSKTIWLNAEGMSYYKEATPERRLANVIKKGGKIELKEALDLARLSGHEKNVAFRWAAEEELLKFERDGQQTVLRFISDKRTLTEQALDSLADLKVDEKALSTDIVSNLRKRHLLEEKESPKTVFVSITENGTRLLRAGVKKLVTQLSPHMLKDGSWRKARFQDYDLKTVVTSLQAGKRHSYLRFIREIKDALISMGFQESDGPIAELEFWNMDVLFMPQDHPARDIHDVFHLDLPPGKVSDEKLWARVQRAHEKGLNGSRGWGYEWNQRFARRIVLRSQTTTVSARALSKKMTPPLRVFCIGRVFRPDQIDWKHFIEFNQCEGIVADENMNFRELLGYLKTFAVEVFGAEAVRFVPSYFPFTEPSVEMYAKVQGKWTEVGGAGMFRPEMLAALQCDVPVLAWGLGLDRLAMKKLGVTDIRELFSQDLNYLRGV